MGEIHMVDIEKYEFNSFLIRKIMPTKQGFSVIGGQEKEDIIYHYTSPEAFLSIVQHQEIRFTDIRYLNDKAEGIYFVKVLLDFLHKNTGKYPIFEEAINELLKGNDWDKIRNLETSEVHYNEIPRMPYKAERVFVFCACAEPDLLNMWNYYVNNGSYQGYNIGLRIKALLNTFDTPTPHEIDAFQVYYGNVIYDERQQMQEIRMLAEGIEKGARISEDQERAAKYAQLTLRAYINTQGAFYKHPKFKAENEFRIIVQILDKRIPHSKEDAKRFTGTNNKKLAEGFCTKRGLIVPYLAVSLPKDSISRVTVAPMVEFGIAKTSIQELFDAEGLQRPPVYKSTIPIRF